MFKGTISKMLDTERKFNSSSELTNGQYDMLVSTLSNNSDNRFKTVLDIISEMLDNQGYLAHGDLVLILESVLTDTVDGMNGFFFSEHSECQTDCCETNDETRLNKEKALEFLGDLRLFIRAIGYEESERCESKVYESWFKFMKAKYADVWGSMGIEHFVQPFCDEYNTNEEFFKYADTGADGKYYNLINLAECIVL